MDSSDAIELGRQAVMITLLVAAPVLAAGMLTGLLVGLVQALTQIQEQTVAFVPKLIIMVLVLTLTMPWLLDQMTQYTQEVITNIPETL